MFARSTFISLNHETRVWLWWKLVMTLSFAYPSTVRVGSEEYIHSIPKGSPEQALNRDKVTQTEIHSTTPQKWMQWRGSLVERWREKRDLWKSRRLLRRKGLVQSLVVGHKAVGASQGWAETKSVDRNAIKARGVLCWLHPLASSIYNLPKSSKEQGLRKESHCFFN